MLIDDERDFRRSCGRTRIDLQHPLKLVLAISSEDIRRTLQCHSGVSDERGIAHRKPEPTTAGGLIKSGKKFPQIRPGVKGRDT